MTKNMGVLTSQCGKQHHGVLGDATRALRIRSYTKYGSWLNLIECAFSKMTRTFLRHIRVASTEELKSRILQGIAEMNEAPVQLRWRNFDLDIA